MEFDIGPKEDQTIVLFDSDAQDEEDGMSSLVVSFGLQRKVFFLINEIDDIESNGDSIVSKAHNHVVLRLQVSGCHRIIFESRILSMNGSFSLHRHWSQNIMRYWKHT